MRHQRVMGTEQLQGENREMSRREVSREADVEEKENIT